MNLYKTVEEVRASREYCVQQFVSMHIGQAQILQRVESGRSETVGLLKGIRDLMVTPGGAQRDLSRASRLNERVKSYVVNRGDSDAAGVPVLDQLMGDFGIDQSGRCPETKHADYRVVCGMGGVGKSSLALELAHLARDQRKYCLTRFMCMQTADDITREWSALATDLDIDLKDKSLADVIAAVYSTLGATSYLLIFDNAPSLSMVAESLLKQPVGVDQHTLITCRDEAGSSVSGGQGWDHTRCYHLGVFSAECTARYVSNFPGVIVDHREGGDERTSALSNLHELLGGLPLALSLACGHISSSGRFGRRKVDVVCFVEELKQKGISALKSRGDKTIDSLLGMTIDDISVNHTVCCRKWFCLERMQSHVLC